MTDKKDKPEEELSLKTDVPKSAFDEALKAVETIQDRSKVQKKSKEGEKRKGESAEDFLKWLSLDAAEMPEMSSSAEEEGERDYDDDLSILSRLLEEEKNLEKEAELLKSYLFDRQDEVVDSEALKEKEGRIHELNDRLLRMKAEFENFKKRIVREKETKIRFSNENLILSLLPVIDNFERALSHADATEDKMAVIEGVRLILKQLYDTLGANGVRRLDAMGQDFDPEYHEAVTSVETEDVDPGKILSQYQIGYLLHGRLLRPAKVAVAARPSRARSNQL